LVASFVLVNARQSPRGFGMGTKMDLQQAITAKRTSKPPTELTPLRTVERLDALGKLLYGEHWIVPMARDLKICPDEITQWALGECEMPPDHPIFGALAVLVHYHDKGVARARKVMDRYQA
jgi:hypothetical protein